VDAQKRVPPSFPPSRQILFFKRIPQGTQSPPDSAATKPFVLTQVRLTGPDQKERPEGCLLAIFQLTSFSHCVNIPANASETLHLGLKT